MLIYKFLMLLLVLKKSSLSTEKGATYTAFDEGLTLGDTTFTSSHSSYVVNDYFTTTESPTTITQAQTTIIQLTSTMTEPLATTAQSLSTKLLSTTTESLSSTTESPSTTIESSSSTTQPPATTAQSLSTTTESLSSTTESPSTTIESSSSTTQPPATTAQSLSTTTESLSSTAESPSTTIESSSSTTQPPATTAQSLSTTTESLSSTIITDEPGCFSCFIGRNYTDHFIYLNWTKPHEKNGILLDYILYRNNDLVFNVTDTSFKDINLKPYTRYNYTLAASTQVGYWKNKSVSCTTQEDIPGEPGIFLCFIGRNDTAHFIYLNWTKPLAENGVLLNYILYKNNDLVFNNSQQSFEDTHLSPYTQYNYTLAASTQVGYGKKKTISCTTQEDIPGLAENVSVKNKGVNSVMIVWEEPTVKNGIVQYRIFYKLKDNSNESKQILFTETNETFVNITGLKEYTEYEFFVQAFTAGGNSTNLKSLFAMTSFGHPRGAPVNLTVADISSTSLNVSWNHPDDFLYVRSYIVYIRNTYETIVSNVTSFLALNLSVFTLYDVTVCAIYPENKTSCSNITGKTLEDIPGEPGSFFCSNGRGDLYHFIYLNWTKPQEENGNILDYILYRNNIWVFNDSYTFFQDRKLTPYTQYNYTLAASTKVGYGKNKSISCTTQEDIPDEPESFFCFNGRNDNGHYIYLNWTEPQVANGILLAYILYRNNVLVEFPILHKHFEDKIDITPYTQYNYTLAASTKIGYGKNKSISCTSQEDKPSEVVNLNFTIITNSSICLEWGKPINPNGRVIYFIKSDTFEDNTTNLYFCQSNLRAFTRYEIFVKACTQVDGEYLCSDKKYIDVTTDYTAPSKYPGNIKWKKSTSTSILINWDLLSSSAENGPIIFYNVTYWAENDNGTKEINTNEIILESLKFYTNYTVTLCACNDKGCGPIYFFQEETGEGLPGPPSLLASYTNSTSTIKISIVISWEMPKHPNGKLLSFRLQYIPTFSKDRDRIKEIEIPLRNILKYEINGLEPYTLYDVSLAAETAVGVGAFDFKKYHTRSAAPSDPPTFIEREIKKTSTTISLSWRPPEKPNGKILIYYVSIKDTLKFNSYNTTVPLFFFKNLKPYTEYSISIGCLSEGGPGPYTQIKVRTSETTPPLPPTVIPPSEPSTEKTITIRISQGSNENGRISYYLIVVIEIINGRPNKKPKDYSISDLNNYEEYLALREQNIFVPYIAANISSDKFPKNGTFVLGSGSKNQARKRRSVDKVYQNGPLLSEKSYFVFQSTHVSRDLYVLSEDWDGPFQTKKAEFKKVEKVEKGGNGGAIAGSIIGVLIAIIFGAALYYFKFRNKDKRDVETKLKSFNKGSFNNGFDSDPGDLKLEPYVPTGLPIKVSNFPAYVRNLSKDGKFLFAEEFKIIQQGKGVGAYLYEHSNHPINREKNRYNNIVAYDHTRVLLRPIDDIPESDYINANYIDGYMGHGSYIATQGPLEQTCQDFWRMCWEQNVSTIVMLTQLIEQGKNKCHKYWPDVGSTCYDMMQITLTESTCLPSYVVRTFSVLHDEYPGQEHFIKQFAFNSWSDHGISNPQTLLTFIRHVNQSITNSDGPSGPVVVHCSAGVGRTGTYIALDVNLKQIEAEGKVEIFKYLQLIRSQRNYMVQTEGQYIFIHDTLLEHIIFGVTEVQVQDLRNHVKKMLQTPTGSSETRIDKEFHKLNLFDPSNTKTIKAASETCNRNKNRYYNVLPYDDTRVCLKPMPGVAGSDYINANFINGYTQNKQFIATQAPLPQTIVSFWRMVWEYDCRTIVCLAQETEAGKVKIHRYWPSIEGAMHGTLMIEHISQNLIGDFIVREFKVTHTTEGHSRTVKHFQYVTWPDNSHPESGSGIVDMIGRVQKWNQQNGTEPIIVHCSNGVGRTGVFIALFNVIDRVRVEGVVDIFQTVRELRSQRPAMVQTKDQYLFCFLALQDFLASFDIYQTFL